MPEPRLSKGREWIALKLAPWLYVPYRWEREEAFKDLAEVAYLSRDAVWTSPGTLVKTALEQARKEGRGAAITYAPTHYAPICTCQRVPGGHLVKGTAICPVHG